MPQIEQQPPKHTGALIVHGSNVPTLTFDILRVHLELLLSELDRTISEGAGPQFDWMRRDRSYRGRRVLVTPDPLFQGVAIRSASRILEHARRGVAVLTGGPRRPPMFTDVALEQLGWIARAVEVPGVERLVSFTGGMAQTISQATLSNLQQFNRSGGGSARTDGRSR